MTTTTTTERTVLVPARPWTLSRLLMVVATALFVIASLVFGGVITGWDAWVFMAGALSAWAFALVV